MVVQVTQAAWGRTSHDARHTAGNSYAFMVADLKVIGALLGLSEDTATGNYFFTPPSGLACSSSLALNANESRPFV
jgi:hypothetical protein